MCGQPAFAREAGLILASISSATAATTRGQNFLEGAFRKELAY